MFLSMCQIRPGLLPGGYFYTSQQGRGIHQKSTFGNNSGNRGELSIENEKILSLPSIVDIIQNEEKSVKRNPVSAEDIFYIIFTSGSTGTPKGVQIVRSCLDHFISLAVTLGDGTAEKIHYTYIKQAPFSFDLSVMDLFLTLYTGGTLWALDKRIQSDMKLLLNSLKNSNTDVWVSPPPL